MPSLARANIQTIQGSTEISPLKKRLSFANDPTNMIVNKIIKKLPEQKISNLVKILNQKTFEPNYEIYKKSSPIREDLANLMNT